MKTKVYKTGAKAGQPRPVKVNKPRRYAKEHAYILAAIDGTGYGREFESDAEKLQFLYDTFKSEYGRHLKRHGEFIALREWLAGLPSAIHIAFYDHEILHLAQEWGSLPADASERQQDKILASWFSFMAMRILGLWRTHKITK